MKQLIAAAVCLMLGIAPAFAQDKGKSEEKKAAPAASAKAEDKKAALAKADEKKAEPAKTAPAKADEKKAAPASAVKKEPTEKQKAQQEKMRGCTKEASDKNLKGDERKKFMSGCLKG